MKVWLDSLDKALLGAAIVRRKKVRGAISYPIDTLLLIDESDQKCFSFLDSYERYIIFNFTDHDNALDFKNCIVNDWFYVGVLKFRRLCSSVNKNS